MREFGHDDRLAGFIAAAGAPGIPLPASAILMLHGVIAETSIGILFAGGMAPGLPGLALRKGAARRMTWRAARRGCAAAGPKGCPRCAGSGRRRRWPPS